MTRRPATRPGLIASLLGGAALLVAAALPSPVAAAATVSSQPAIVALPDAVTTVAPGAKVQARFRVTIPAGWPSDSGYIVYFSQTAVWSGSAVPLRASIPGCAPVPVSTELACTLDPPAGRSTTFTYSAPAPVVGATPDTLSAELVQIVVPNSQLGYAYYGTASATFSVGVPASSEPGVAAFVAPVTPGELGDTPPPPVVAAGAPFAAAVVVPVYNATVSGLTVVVTGPPGATLTPDATFGSDSASSFTCTSTAATTTICTGGTVPAGGDASWLLTGTAPATAGPTPLGVVADPADAAPSGVLGAPAAATSGFTVSTTLPDLALTVSKPPIAYVGAPYREVMTITNVGRQTAVDPMLVASTAAYASSVTSRSMVCVDTQRGHSGRGGGYTHTGYACSRAKGTVLRAGASLRLVATLTPTSTAPTTQILTATTTSPQQGLATHTVDDSTTAVLPPAPAAPTDVAVAQRRDALAVTFTPGATGADGVPVSSTVTATPVAGGPSLVASATSSSPRPVTLLLAGVTSATTYAVTVSSADLTGMASAAASPFTTVVSTIVPGAPTMQRAYWAGTSIIGQWRAGVAGDSVTSDYQVRARPAEAGPKPILVDAGTSLEGVLPGADVNTGWIVSVRAEDAAGWGPWSKGRFLPGP